MTGTKKGAASGGLSAVQTVLLIVAMFVLVGGTYFFATGGLKSTAAPPAAAPVDQGGLGANQSAPQQLQPQPGQPTSSYAGINYPVYVYNTNDPNHAALSGVPVFTIVNGIAVGTTSTVNGSASINIPQGVNTPIYIGDDTTSYMKSYIVNVVVQPNVALSPQYYGADLMGQFGKLDNGASAVANGGQVNWTTNTAGTHYERAMNITDLNNTKPLNNVKVYMLPLTPGNPDPFSTAPYLKWGNNANPYSATYAAINSVSPSLLSGYTFGQVSTTVGTAQPTLVADINSLVLVNNTAYSVCVDDMNGATVATFPGTTGTGAAAACYTLNIQK